MKTAAILIAVVGIIAMCITHKTATPQLIGVLLIGIACALDIGANIHTRKTKNKKLRPIK